MGNMPYENDAITVKPKPKIYFFEFLCTIYILKILKNIKFSIKKVLIKHVVLLINCYYRSILYILKKI
jgi:hypothetical protein